MITLAMAQMVYFVCCGRRSPAARTGCRGVPRGKLLGLLDLESDTALYFVVLAVFVAVFLFIVRTMHLAFGQVLKAIRENEPRRRLAGLRRRQVQAAAFVLSTGWQAWPAH